MKKTILTIFLFLAFAYSFGQAYIGTIIKNVNLRTGPSVDYEISRSLKQSSKIFIISLDTENEFYNIIDIATNKEGFVKKSFVRLLEEVKLNKSGMFIPEGNSLGNNPEIEIYNNTNKLLSLKLNEEMFHFAPQEKKSISLSSGPYSYRASAPGVTPNIGNEEIKGRIKYTWQFYIVKR